MYLFAYAVAFAMLVVAHSFAWGVVRTIGDEVETRHFVGDLVVSAITAGVMAGLVLIEFDLVAGRSRWRGDAAEWVTVLGSAGAQFIAGRARFGYVPCVGICYPCHAVTLLSVAWMQGTDSPS